MSVIYNMLYVLSLDRQCLGCFLVWKHNIRLAQRGGASTCLVACAKFVSTIKWKWWLIECLFAQLLLIFSWIEKTNDIWLNFSFSSQVIVSSLEHFLSFKLRSILSLESFLVDWCSICIDLFAFIFFEYR